MADRAGAEGQKSNIWTLYLSCLTWDQPEILRCKFEIALSIYALRLCPTFEKLNFTGLKVQRNAQMVGVGCKTVYEIEPREVFQRKKM